MKHQSVKSVPKYFRFVTIDSTQTLSVHEVIYFGVEVEFRQKVIHQVCQVNVQTTKEFNWVRELNTCCHFLHLNHKIEVSFHIDRVFLIKTSKLIKYLMERYNA